MPAVLDRVAVVVGTGVITESEVIEEARVTDFLNGRPLDLGPAALRQAADRLVDQQLIRNEMEIGRYTEPPNSEGEAMEQKFRQEHYSSQAAFRAALQKYGITEQELREHLLWQLTALRFTDQRFRSTLPPATGEAAREAPEAPSEVQTASAGQGSSARTEAAAGGDVDQKMDAWLKDARSHTRIQFKKEALQ